MHSRSYSAPGPAAYIVHWGWHWRVNEPK